MQPRTIWFDESRNVIRIDWYKLWFEPNACASAKCRDEATSRSKPSVPTIEPLRGCVSISSNTVHARPDTSSELVE